MSGREPGARHPRALCFPAPSLYNAPTMVRVVFMGSPEFAIPSLRTLHAHYKVAGVISQPDRPAGRGRRPLEPPVKRVARDLGIATMQPATLRASDVMPVLRAWAPDIIIVAAFGRILRPEMLDLPRFGCLNVHASLLPRHRGAAPIPAAILAGDSETGATIMQMDAGLDTGRIVAQRSDPISADDTASSLSERVARLGAQLLADTLPGYLAGDIVPVPQDESRATYARQLRKHDGRLDWTRPADELARRVRAYNPWPGAFTSWHGEPLKLLRVRPAPSGSADPGAVFLIGGEVAIGTGHGALVVAQLQPAGRRPMSAGDFVRGAPDFVGATLVSNPTTQLRTQPVPISHP